jgi:hypothetical protein
VGSYEARTEYLMVVGDHVSGVDAGLLASVFHADLAGCGVGTRKCLSCRENSGLRKSERPAGEALPG